MNQAELIAKVASLSGLPRNAVQTILKVSADVIAAELMEGGEVLLPGLGRLTVEARAARNGRNPQTGEALQIPAKRVAKFHPTPALKDAINTH